MVLRHDLQLLTVRDALRAMAEKAISCEQLAEACLARIALLEPTVGAWAYLNPEQVLAQARQADCRRQQGLMQGRALNGIPVGIKDIFDTCDMPTENGTPANQGRQPDTDATVVRLLREAGAVIAGKTVTTELAVYSPGKTTNPHDPGRTPGGSSSGSAAAVACGMVPLAVGTQTNGSVIRPASYCGVVGFKPTFGTIPRDGILRQAPSLDQVGVFSRQVYDSALLVSAIRDRVRNHGDTLPWPEFDLKILAAGLQRPPRLALARTALWPEAAAATKKALLAAVGTIGCKVEELILPAITTRAIECHRTIMLGEMAHNYHHLYREHRQALSRQLLDMLEAGRAITLSRYLAAKNLATEIAGELDNAMAGYDCVLTPATPAAAPAGLASTGSPIFSTLWSLCGSPALSLPVLADPTGLPLGLQLVGARGGDMRLLQAAQWLEEKFLSPRTQPERSS
jgi:Asp-tRNA(Asn)/Glu-tRNA(Gln) amidotransferase A subunit family amidase